MTMPLLEGNWIDYAETMRELGRRYRPASVLELGCGFFIAAHAIAEAGTLQRYVGVDVRPYSTEVENFRSAAPNCDVTIIRASVHEVIVPPGPYDMVLIDAHDGDAEQWGKDTTAQCRIAVALSPRVIVVDDCCVTEVDLAARAILGLHPTGSSETNTLIRWWER